MRKFLAMILICVSSFAWTQTTIQVVRELQNNPTLRQQLIDALGLNLNSPYSITAGNGVAVTVSNRVGNLSATTTAATATVLRAFPWKPDFSFVTDTASFEISSAAAGGIVWGIYANQSDTSLYPGTLLFQKYDTTSAEVKGVSLASQNIRFQQNHTYWIAYSGNGTASYRSVPIGAIWGGLGDQPIGASNNVCGLTIAKTMNWTLPVTFPASATILTSVATPLIVMRVR